MDSYDLYVSVGPICRCAYHLKRNGLRKEAFPLDWQLNYSLETVIHLFNTEFKDFFVDIEEDVEKSKEKENRWIIDKKNNIISIHHFSKDIYFEDQKQQFCDKMQKRFARLHAQLKMAKRIVLIGTRKDSVKKLKSFLDEFSDIYPNLEIKLINIRNDINMHNDEFYKTEYKISNKHTIEEYIFNDSMNCETGEMYGWKGNIQMWDAILKDYKLLAIWDNIYEYMNQKSVVIFGAGKKCCEIIELLTKNYIYIEGIAVTELNNNPSNIKNICVDKIERFKKESLVIISVRDKEERLKIRRDLYGKGYLNCIDYEK